MANRIINLQMSYIKKKIQERIKLLQKIKFSFSTSFGLLSIDQIRHTLPTWVVHTVGIRIPDTWIHLSTVYLSVQ